MSHPTLIEVAVPTPLRKNFSYLCPLQFPLPAIGVRVTVPFAGRELVGLVTAHLDAGEIKLDKLKSLINVLDEKALQPPAMHKKLKWASNYYLYSLGEIYQQAQPALLRKGEAAKLIEHLQWCLTEQGKNIELTTLARAKKQLALMNY